MLGRAKKFDENKTSVNELIEKCTAHSDAAMLAQLFKRTNSKDLKSEEGMAELSLRPLSGCQGQQRKDVRVLAR